METGLMCTPPNLPEKDLGHACLMCSLLEGLTPDCASQDCTPLGVRCDSCTVTRQGLAGSSNILVVQWSRILALAQR